MLLLTHLAVLSTLWSEMKAATLSSNALTPQVSSLSVRSDFWYCFVCRAAMLVGAIAILNKAGLKWLEALFPDQHYASIWFTFRSGWQAALCRIRHFCRIVKDSFHLHGPALLSANKMWTCKHNPVKASQFKKLSVLVRVVTLIWRLHCLLFLHLS